jgi:hypothetical protein
VVKLLVEKGAELEAKSVYGRTLLSWDAYEGHEAVKLGLGASRPERNLQYHRAKSLTSMLLGTWQFFCRHSEAETPLLDMKLRGSGQRSAEERELELLKRASRRSRAPILSTNLGPSAGSVCIYPKAHPSFAVHYPPLHRPPVPSHSPLLFDGNPPAVRFQPIYSRRRGTDSSRQGRQ